MLLLDILDVSDAKTRSGVYLAHSLRFFASKSISASVTADCQFLTSLLEKVAEKETFVDNPFSWLALTNLKLISESSAEINDWVAFEELIRGLLKDYAYPEGLRQSEFQSNGFRYLVPLNIGNYFRLDNWDWSVVVSSQRYSRWNDVLGVSVDLFRSINPAILSELEKLASHILILKSHNHSHGSMSPRSLIGNIFLPEIDDSSIVSECLIHECLHQYLYRIEHCGQIFFESQGTKELYYSPWKDVPRPLTMVLHGAFVFTGVCMFYDRLLCNETLPLSSLEFLNRLRKRYSQVFLALEVLKRNNYLTDFGADIMSILEDSIAEIGQCWGMVNKPVTGFVNEHRNLFATKDMKHVDVS